MSDQQIIEAFIREYGAGIYLGAAEPVRHADPLSRRGRGALRDLDVHPQIPQAANRCPNSDRLKLDDPALAKYKDQIEKDLANLSDPG